MAGKGVGAAALRTALSCSEVESVGIARRIQRRKLKGGRLLSDQAAKKVQGPQVVRIGGVSITGRNTRQDGEARDLTRRRMIMSTHRPEGSKGLFAAENDRFRQTRYLVPG